MRPTVLNQLEKVRKICAEFTNMVCRIFNFWAHNSDNFNQDVGFI